MEANRQFMLARRGRTQLSDCFDLDYSPSLARKHGIFLRAGASFHFDLLARRGSLPGIKPLDIRRGVYAPRCALVLQASSLPLLTRRFTSSGQESQWISHSSCTQQYCRLPMLVLDGSSAAYAFLYILVAVCGWTLYITVYRLVSPKFLAPGLRQLRISIRLTSASLVEVDSISRLGGYTRNMAR